MTARSFHIGDVLSITTGILVAPGHMAAVHELLDFMTGDSLFTHQLIRAAEECAPALLAQHPRLATVEAPSFGPARDVIQSQINNWLHEVAARFGGEHLDVVPLPTGAHEVIDPLTELARMRPDAQVIAVTMDGAS